MKTKVICDTCEFLCRQEGENFCHITNPGVETKIDDTEDNKCPRWERRSMYGRERSKSRKKPVEDFIVYEILR